MNEDTDYIELKEEQIEVLAGLHHPCPVCFHLLSIRPMPDPTVGERYWYCPKCHTEWEVADLIMVYNYNELEGGLI